MINNASGSDYESSDSELSSEAPPLPPPRTGPLNPSNEGDSEDEESLVSESDSDENESSPPPLPPPRDFDLRSSDEYVIFFNFHLIYIYFSMYRCTIIKFV